MRIPLILAAFGLTTVLVGAQPPQPPSEPPPVAQPAFPFSEEQSKEWNPVRVIEGGTWGICAEDYQYDTAPVPYPTDPVAIDRLREVRNIPREDPKRLAATDAAVAAARAANDLPALAWALRYRSQVWETRKKPVEALDAIRQAQKVWVQTGYYPGAVLGVAVEIRILIGSQQYRPVLERVALAEKWVAQEKTRMYSLGVACIGLASLCGIATNESTDIFTRPDYEAARDRAFDLAIAALDKIPATLFRAGTLKMAGEAAFANRAYGDIGTEQGILGDLKPGLPLTGGTKRAQLMLLRARREFVRFAELSEFARVQITECDSDLSTIALVGSDLAEAKRRGKMALEGYLALPPSLIPEESLNLTLQTTVGLAGAYLADKNIPEAEELSSQALRLWKQKKTFDPNSKYHGALMFQILGDTTQIRGKLAEAQEHYRAGLAILPDPQTIIHQTLTASLGSVSLLRGDYDQARDMYTVALNHMRKVVQGDVSMATVLVNRSLAYFKMGDAALADKDLSEAREIFRMRLRANPTEPIALAGETDCILQLGVIAHQRGREALEENQKTVANTYFAAAQTYTQTALTRFQQRDKNSLETARALGNLAAILIDRGNLQAAEKRAKEGLALYDRLAPNSLECAYLLGTLGDCLLRRGQTRAAIAKAERGVAILEQQRSLINQVEKRALVTARQADLFPVLVEGYLAQGNTARGFLALEQSRSRSLVDSISERVVKHDSKQYPEPLSLDAAQKALPEGTVALSYFIGPRKSFLFILSGGVKPTVRFVPLLVTETALSQQVSRFSKCIESRNPTKNGGETLPWGKESEALYSLLLSPAANEIATAKRVLICPDGPLNSLPFAALSRSLPEGERIFLIDQKPFHLTPSLTLLNLLNRSLLATDGDRIPMLAIGMPVWKPAPDSPQPLPGVARLGLRPKTGIQATDVAKLYGVSARLEAAATERIVYEYGPRADILHFACHGKGDKTNPMNARLYLVPTVRPGVPPLYSEDGDLHSWELYSGRLRLTASLVTLSACETGQGKQVRYEGMDSLARAFLYAGARSVAYTLWEADDEASAELMREFYTRLKDPNNPALGRDAALRDAMRIVRKKQNLSHPFFWASFQLMGIPD